MSDSQATSADSGAPIDLFDPVGYVVLAFGSAADADRARDSLLDGGYATSDLKRFSGAEVLARTEADQPKQGLFSYLREEHEEVEEYAQIARDGGAFLLARAESDAEAARVATVGKRGDLRRASQYGKLTFTDLR
jgi:hypothetical protein